MAQRSATSPQNNLGRSATFATLAWSFDGRLVFGVYDVNGADHGELYLWDGRTTTSFSQNSSGWDGAPAWSADGRLAFLSAWNGGNHIFVWDGVSLRDGSPDHDTFADTAPELITSTSFPTWTNADRLAFAGTGSQDQGYSQIYVWDGQAATDLSQIPNLHTRSTPQWSADGRWAFVNLVSDDHAVLYVRDADNNTLLTLEGGTSPAWSSSSGLAFCTRDESQSQWVLSVWDGTQVTEIVRGDVVFARWGNSSEATCASVQR